MALAMGGFVVGVLERNYEAALDAIDRSLGLSSSSALAFGFSAIVRVLCGDDDKAIEHAASRAAAANPRFSVPRYLHTAALVRLGRLEEAQAAKKVLLDLQPNFTVSSLISGNVTTPARLAMLADALREAGVPE